LLPAGLLLLLLPPFPVEVKVEAVVVGKKAARRERAARGAFELRRGGRTKSLAALFLLESFDCCCCCCCSEERGDKGDDDNAADAAVASRWASKAFIRFLPSQHRTASTINGLPVRAVTAASSSKAVLLLLLLLLLFPLLPSQSPPPPTLAAPPAAPADAEGCAVHALKHLLACSSDGWWTTVRPSNSKGRS
jgi:hypothetical protein